MKTTKDIIKIILSEQNQEAEEFSPPDGPPYNDYYDVGLALRRIVVDPDNGNWIDTDYIDEESIQTSWDIKEAEKMYQKKLFELEFFDSKGKIKESHVDGKGKNYIKDIDKSGKDNNDLCDELTINSVKELRRKMRGMNISKKDKVKINKFIKEMKKTNKKLSVDLDVNNTYLRYIQNMLCTYSQEDKNNIDETRSIIKRILSEEKLSNYTNKEQVKDMIADNLTGEIISMLNHSDQMGLDNKLTYNDLSDILTNVYENAEFLFMGDDLFNGTVD